jgi:IS605 OrfB family transposase
LITYETRLRLNKAQESLISELCATHGKAVRQAFACQFRDGLTSSETYYLLQREFGLTSAQVGSAQNVAEMLYKRQLEADKFLNSKLEAGIKARKEAIEDANRALKSFAKQLESKQQLAGELAPAVISKKTKRFVDTLSDIRSLKDKIARKCRWLAMKKKGLVHKERKLLELTEQLNEGKVSVCFGSKRLLAQNPMNNKDSIFDSYESWRAEWNLRRHNQLVSIGRADAPCGNPEVQWHPDSNVLRIRLTDSQAKVRMQELAEQTAQDVLNGKSPKCCNLRMKARFIEIPNVDFSGHLDKASGLSKARQHLQALSGKVPMTSKIVIRDNDGERKYHLQISVNTAAPSAHSTRERGALGLDFNAKGVAWSVVKPDGNLEAGQQGFIPWSLRNEPSGSVSVQVGTVAKRLAQIALKYNVAMAIENLDFSNTKAKVTASYVDAKGRKFNAILSSLASSKFKEMVQKNCRENGIGLYFVNPCYSSVGGFAKYGYLTRASVDEAASHWIARQALYGQTYKRREMGSNEFGVKLFKEKLGLHGQPYSAKQSKSAADGLTWRTVSLALGQHRFLWQRNLRELIVSQVATTLPISVVADIEPEKGIEETVRSIARQASCAVDLKLIPA